MSVFCLNHRLTLRCVLLVEIKWISLWRHGWIMLRLVLHLLMLLLVWHRLLVELHLLVLQQHTLRGHHHHPLDLLLLMRRQRHHRLTMMWLLSHHHCHVLRIATIGMWLLLSFSSSNFQ